MGQRMVLRWAEEQWAGSVPLLKSAQEALEKLKKEAELAAVKEKDTRFTLEVMPVPCLHRGCGLPGSAGLRSGLPLQGSVMMG